MMKLVIAIPLMLVAAVAIWTAWPVRTPRSEPSNIIVGCLLPECPWWTRGGF